MESEQRAYLRILESVSQEPDIVRQEAQKLRDNYHKKLNHDLVSHVRLEKQVSAFHETPERSLQEGHRIAAERDRAMFERSSHSSNIRGRETQARHDGTHLSEPKRKRWTLKVICNVRNAGLDSSRSIPSRSVTTVPAAWTGQGGLC